MNMMITTMIKIQQNKKKMIRMKLNQKIAIIKQKMNGNLSQIKLSNSLIKSQKKNNLKNLIKENLVSKVIK